MPELDGIQLIRLAGKRSKIILTTAYSEYALEGYEHDIIDYLLKPILFDRFLKAVQKTVAILSKPFADPSLEIPLGADDFIFVRTETRNKIVRVILRDIEYIEGMGNYVSIFTAAARIITLSTIRELEEKLPQGFIRIHHSYLVPIQKITAAEGNQVQISKHTLPIGDVYKKAFLAAIEKRVINKK
jgi:DNA-binding LytR/AlgR family response regulator